MTYRAGPHSTSDDPGRYRTLEEEQLWVKRDPLVRFREQLMTAGILTDEQVAQVDTDARQAAEEMRDGIMALTDRPVSDMFDFTFTRLTPELISQREAAQQEARA